MQNKVVAIILARGGSKGIPRKNVLNFVGHPLVAWSVMQAKQTKEIDEVYVSSDSDEILEIATTVEFENKTVTSFVEKGNSTKGCI